jgi:hypothetical protein
MRGAEIEIDEACDLRKESIADESALSHSESQ